MDLQDGILTILFCAHYILANSATTTATLPRQLSWPRNMSVLPVAALFLLSFLYREFGLVCFIHFHRECGLLYLFPSVLCSRAIVHATEEETRASKPAKALRSSRCALSSTVTSFFQIHSSRFGAPAVVREEFSPVIQCIPCFSFIPVWSTSRGMGGVPPNHNTVIKLCAVSFLLNHDPDLNIFSLRTSGLLRLAAKPRARPLTSPP